MLLVAVSHDTDEKKIILYSNLHHHKFPTTFIEYGLAY